MTTTITGHPEHQGLGFSERGDKVWGTKVKHWHRYADHGAERRRLVVGTVEGCDDAYAAGEEPLSDEALLAKIREADEAQDPAPQIDTPVDDSIELQPLPLDKSDGVTEIGGDECGDLLPGDENLPLSRESAAEAVLDSLPEGSFLASKDPEMAEFFDGMIDGVPSLVITKPERGGKRVCGCHHSESRHNASGPCRTCECTDFAIPA